MAAPEDLQIGAIHWKDKTHFPQRKPFQTPAYSPLKSGRHTNTPPSLCLPPAPRGSPKHPRTEDLPDPASPNLHRPVLGIPQREEAKPHHYDHLRFRDRRRLDVHGDREG